MFLRSAAVSLRNCIKYSPSSITSLHYSPSTKYNCTIQILHHYTTQSDLGNEEDVEEIDTPTLSIEELKLKAKYLSKKYNVTFEQDEDGDFVVARDYSEIPKTLIEKPLELSYSDQIDIKLGYRVQDLAQRAMDDDNVIISQADIDELGGERVLLGESELVEEPKSNFVPPYSSTCTNVECNKVSDPFKVVSDNPRVLEITNLKCTCLRGYYIERKMVEQLQQANDVKHKEYTDKFTQLTTDAKTLIPRYNESKNYYQLNQFFAKCLKAMDDWEHHYSVAEGVHSRLNAVWHTVSKRDQTTVKRLFQANKWVPLLKLVKRLENPNPIRAPKPIPPPRPPPKEPAPILGQLLEGGLVDDQGYEAEYNAIGVYVKPTYLKRKIFTSSRDLGFGGYKQKEMPNFTSQDEREKWLKAHPEVKDTSPPVIHSVPRERGKERGVQVQPPTVKGDTENTYITRIPGHDIVGQILEKYGMFEEAAKQANERQIASLALAKEIARKGGKEGQKDAKKFLKATIAKPGRVPDTF